MPDRETAKTRYFVLAEVLTIMESVKRSFSRNGNNQSPKEGYEEAFADEERQMQVIRDMMIEYRTIMEGPSVSAKR